MGKALGPTRQAPFYLSLCSPLPSTSLTGTSLLPALAKIPLETVILKTVHSFSIYIVDMIYIVMGEWLPLRQRAAWGRCVQLGRLSTVQGCSSERLPFTP